MFVGFWKIKNKTRQVGVLWFCPRLFKPTGTGLIIISSFFKIPFNLSFCDVVILTPGFCILDTPQMAFGEFIFYHIAESIYCNRSKWKRGCRKSRNRLNKEAILEVCYDLGHKRCGERASSSFRLSSEVVSFSAPPF